ncbi:MAG: DOMON domain-containing protein [Candidatus Hodarchaeales archaeon]|jgi:hypothetical protein
MKKKNKFFLIFPLILIILNFTIDYRIRGSITSSKSHSMGMNFLSVDSIPIIDGIIESNEYQSSITLSTDEYQLYWQIHEETIYWGMEAKTKGWVAIGFDPTSNMKDADMVFGWVTSASMVEIRDCYSTGTYGPHPPDIELGGTDDIIAFNGTENSETTIIEFSRLLEPDDEYDNNIPKTGSYKIIWSFGNSDDFNQGHTKRGEKFITMNSTYLESSTTLDINSSDNSSVNASTGFEMNIILISIMVLPIIYTRRKKLK